jgi:hypothetical protein
MNATLQAGHRKRGTEDCRRLRASPDEEVKVTLFLNDRAPVEIQRSEGVAAFRQQLLGCLSQVFRDVVVEVDRPHLGRQSVVRGFPVGPLEPRHHPAGMRGDRQNLPGFVDVQHGPSLAGEDDQTVFVHREGYGESSECAAARREAPFLRTLEYGEEVARLDNLLSFRSEHQDAIWRLLDQSGLRRPKMPQQLRKIFRINRVERPRSAQQVEERFRTDAAPFGDDGQ